MAEPVVSRKQLRRAIARAEHLQFFLKYGDDEVGLATDSTTTSLHCPALVQANDFWNNGWAYVLSTGSNAERRISDFSSTGDTLALEYALSTAPSNGEKLEVYDLFSPTNIHAKINEAIERASRFFPDTVLDTSLVFEQDKLRYSLTSLSKRVHKLQRVQVGRINNSVTGLVSNITTSGADKRIFDNSIFTVADQYNGWTIVFYAGTGTGSVGTIDDTDPTGYVQVTTTDLVVVPAVGTKFRIFNPAYQTVDFADLTYRYVDTPEYPDTLYIEGNFPHWYGYRMYLSYTSLPGALTADTDTTIIPAGIIIARARALLHEDLMGNNRADAQRHQTLAQYFHAQADTYTQQALPQRPPIMQSFQGNLGVSGQEIDPMGWEG